MGKGTKKSGRQSSPRKGVTKGRDKGLGLVHPNAAGIDIGSREHYVAVPEDRCEESVRRFTSFTRDLYELADWLTASGIETVAMESTGVYWIPLYDILSERGFEVYLVNARHVKHVSGRKTDVSDCQWLQKLHSYGLLSGAFRPAPAICEVRSYQRHRDMLVSQVATHTLHIQKALTQMNLQVHHVLSDITGVTGMKIVRAIIAGERDGKVLSGYRDGRCKESQEVLEKSLQGHYRAEHVFSLKQAVELYDIYHEKIEACDDEIEKLLKRIEGRVDLEKTEVPKEKRLNRRGNSNAPKFDLHSELFRITGVNLCALPGLNSYSVFKLVSEVGLDMSRWKSAKQFCSWLGLCPKNKISGGKVLSSRTQRSANRAAGIFRLCASTLYRSQTALGAFYRRMKARIGGPEAVTAAAHKLARLFYTLLKEGKAYSERGQDYYEMTYRARVTNNLKKRAKQLGFELVALPDNEPTAPQKKPYETTT